MRFELSIDAIQAIKKLESISNKIINFTDILIKIGENIILSEVQEHFDNQQNQDGSTWLSPKADPTRKALMKTMRYKNSFKSKINGNSIEIRSNFTNSKSNNIVFTHEVPLKINIFGRGVLYQFPKRSAVWLSKKAIEQLIPNLILKEINA